MVHGAAKTALLHHQFIESWRLNFNEELPISRFGFTGSVRQYTVGWLFGWGWNAGNR
jgi:hypothetical protein